MSQIEITVREAYEARDSLSPESVSPETRQAIFAAINDLDSGKARIAEKKNGEWRVNEWLKQAVLCFFRINREQIIPGAYTQFFDKVPLKYGGWTEDELRASKTRVVPSAHVRIGAYVGPNVVLMPSYVNIGAFIDEGTMVDTWATVGSCAQIGKHVHLSGGVGIGGVLEPLQASPTIIEDNCFIGARSEVVEGVIVREGSVISMGVYLGQSTPIYDRQSGEIHYGEVPPGSVVIPGSLPSKDRSHSLYAAIIVKQVDEKTKQKVGINALLRASIDE